MSVTALRRGLAPACCLLVCALMPSSAVASARHDRIEARIVSAMNKVRATYGLPALRVNGGLARAADAHSRTMLRRNVMSHGAFGARVRRYVRVRKVGENLAWMSRCNANTIVQMWMSSADHRHIVLSSAFRQVGVGKRSSSRVCFVTADFATAH